MNNVNFASHADDNTIYNSARKIDSFIMLLQELARIILQWFLESQINGNIDKYHLIMSTDE